MTTTYSIPQRSAVNWRLIVFLFALSLPFVGFGYLILRPGIVRHGDWYEVDLKTLGNFPFDPAHDDVSAVPRQFRELDGKRVQLSGFMYDVNSAGSTTKNFQFVYNIQKCCFGGPPRVQERVFAHVPNGSVEHYDLYTLVDLTGILHVRVVRDPAGGVSSVFDLDVEKAEPRT